MQMIPKIWPRALRILVAPRDVFYQTRDLGTGYGQLFLWLGLEFILVRPLAVTRAVIQASASPAASLGGLWTEYMNYALPPALAVFLAGLALHFGARGDEEPNEGMEIWTTASIMAFTWFPHTVLVAAGATVAVLGWDHPLLPHHWLLGVGTESLGLGWLVIPKILIDFAPTVGLGLLAARTLLSEDRRPVARAAPSVFAWLPGCALLLVLASIASTGYFVQQNWRSVRPLLPGDQLTDLRLVDIHGRRQVIASTAGEVALVDFWATWCPPCVASLPELEKLHRELGGRGFRLISINVEPRNVPGVTAFLKRTAVTFPVYVDNGLLQRRFQVSNFPTAFLVDKLGIVREVYMGAANADRMRRDIEALLAVP